MKTMTADELLHWFGQYMTIMGGAPKWAIRITCSSGVYTAKIGKLAASAEDMVGAMAALKANVESAIA